MMIGQRSFGIKPIRRRIRATDLFIVKEVEKTEWGWLFIVLRLMEIKLLFALALEHLPATKELEELVLLKPLILIGIIYGFNGLQKQQEYGLMAFKQILPMIIRQRLHLQILYWQLDVMKVALNVSMAKLMISEFGILGEQLPLCLIDFVN